MTNLDIFLIDYDIYRINPNWWLEITDNFLKPGLRLRASFESDQSDILESLSFYDSELKINREKYLTNVDCLISKEMIRDFKKNYKVKLGDDIDYYSPFFTLEIGHQYCSAHHGREIYLTDLNDCELKKVLEIVKPLKKYLKIDFS